MADPSPSTSAGDASTTPPTASSSGGRTGVAAAWPTVTDALAARPHLALPVVAAGLAVLLALVLSRRRRVGALTATKRGSADGPVILIAGPPGAGKTALFLRLRDGPGGPANLGTVSSLAENEAGAAVGARGRRVHLVDAPGHPRLRALGASHAPGAAALVFVVDAAAFLAGKADAADQLAGLVRRLGTKARRRRGSTGGPPILLVANKADLGVAAHSPDFIRKRLEREVEAGRAAAGGTLAADEDGGGSGRPLSPPGQAFTFDGLRAVGGGDLTAVAASATGEDVAAVEEWLAGVVG